MSQRLLRFLVAPGNSPFERDLVGAAPDHGHITGSAWVVNPARTRVLLLHHAKLGKWVQPGGHCDGDSNVLAVALRETLEETGLTAAPVSQEIFDIDIHEIPEYWNTPAHLHFDVRYLLEADDVLEPKCNNESRAVRWVELDEVLNLTNEESVRRMVEKTRRFSP